MSTAPRAGRVSRFSWGERALHWLLAVCFFIMLVSGLMLFVPALADLVARPTAKAWHINASLALAAGTLVLFAVHWRRLLATLRQIDRFSADDLRWLRGLPRRLVTRSPAPPQGRFNAGQKLNSALVGGLMVVSYITGGLLWLGERDTRFRLAGTVDVHDWVMWFLIVLVLGHLYLALVHPSTRHALRGMTLGDVDVDWARRHHAAWAPPAEAPPPEAAGPVTADADGEPVPRR